MRSWELKGLKGRFRYIVVQCSNSLINRILLPHFLEAKTSALPQNIPTDPHKEASLNDSSPSQLPNR